MFQLTINEKGGQSKSLDFDKSEITIGRVQGNDVVLPKGNISKRHSRIVLKDGKFIIIDMQSTNGTYVNGKKITTPQVVKSTDKIYIGDFTLQLSTVNGAAVAAPDAPAAAATSARGRGGRQEEDLFTEKPVDDEGGIELNPRAGGPGLIDDNFDQEFEGGAEPEPEPEPEPPRPAAAVKAASSKRVKEPEPEPEPDLDLELEGVIAPPSAREPEPDEGGLDLDSDFPAHDEPEPPKAAVVPMKAGPKSLPKNAPTARAMPTPLPAPSRLKPVTSKPKTGKEDLLEAHDEPVKPSIPPPSGEVHTPVPQPQQPFPSAGVMMPPLVSAPAQALDRRAAVQVIQRALIDDLGLRGVPLVDLAGKRGSAEVMARRLADRLRSSGRVSPEEPIDPLAQEAVRAALDVEPIAELFGDDAVHEVVITHSGEILVERDGQLTPTEQRIDREDDVVAMIRRLATLAGIEDADSRCLFDLRLRDGARMVAAVPPLAFRGPTLSLRKTAREAFTLEALVQHGTLSEAMMRFLENCVRYRRGVLLSVGPGVGASATLNALASLVPIDERVVSIECGVELHPVQTNLTSFEPSSSLGVGELIRHAVSMQPDRALIGLLSGPSVHDVVTAVAGPLEGSVACCSAQTAQQALDRLALDLSGQVVNPALAQRMVARAFPVILQEHRFADGSRRITQIAEVHSDGESVSVEDVFAFEVEGVDENGLITGTFKATGHVPRFLEELHDRGLEVNMAIFQS